MLSYRQKEVITFGIMLVIISASFLLYYTHKVKIINAEYTGNIAAVKNELQERNDRLAYEFKKLEESVNTKTKKIEADLKKQSIDISQNVNTRMANLQQESREGIFEITGKLSRIENEKNFKLTQIEDKVKMISANNNDYAGIIKDAVGSVVSVETFGGKASGTVVGIDETGKGSLFGDSPHDIPYGGTFDNFPDSSFIVTSLHVLGAKGAAEGVVVIETNAGKRETASVIGTNQAYDLAVLKTSLRLDAFEYGDSKKISIGEKVFALGNPGGIGISVTEGIISATQRYAGNIPYIQTDSPINEGNSGGPLINARGELIGINTLKVVGYEGISLATPSYIVKSVADSIIKNYKNKK